jgi:hypothetical protein
MPIAMSEPGKECIHAAAEDDRRNSWQGRGDSRTALAVVESKMNWTSGRASRRLAVTMSAAALTLVQKQMCLRHGHAMVSLATRPQVTE